VNEFGPLLLLIYFVHKAAIFIRFRIMPRRSHRSSLVEFPLIRRHKVAIFVGAGHNDAHFVLRLRGRSEATGWLRLIAVLRLGLNSPDACESVMPPALQCRRSSGAKTINLGRCQEVLLWPFYAAWGKHCWVDACIHGGVWCPDRHKGGVERGILGHESAYAFMRPALGSQAPGDVLSQTGIIAWRSRSFWCARIPDDDDGRAQTQKCFCVLLDGDPQLLLVQGWGPVLFQQFI